MHGQARTYAAAGVQSLTAASKMSLPSRLIRNCDRRIHAALPNTDRRSPFVFIKRRLLPMSRGKFMSTDIIRTV